MFNLLESTEHQPFSKSVKVLWWRLVKSKLAPFWIFF